MYFFHLLHLLLYYDVVKYIAGPWECLEIWEGLEGQVVILPLVEVGLTDLPKSGGATPSSDSPACIDIDLNKVTSV